MPKKNPWPEGLASEQRREPKLSHYRELKAVRQVRLQVKNQRLSVSLGPLSTSRLVETSSTLTFFEIHGILESSIGH